MTERHTVDSITSDELDQLYAALDRVRAALASFDSRGVIAPGHVNLDVPTAGEVLDAVRAALDAPASSETGFVPATSQHFADMPRTDADPLVIEPYRNDCNQPRWAFRCWGTDTCDGWLSLELTSERWAEVVRERHISEAHPELVANNADESARTTANNRATGKESARGQREVDGKLVILNAMDEEQSGA